MINDAIRPACSAGGIGNQAAQGALFFWGGRRDGAEHPGPGRCLAGPGHLAGPEGTCRSVCLYGNR